MEFLQNYTNFHLILPWYMIFHFSVDFCCGASVILAGTTCVQHKHALFYVAFYNFLAFCTQPLTGAGCDWMKRDRLFLYVALAMVFAGGMLVYLVPWFAVILLGFGNSLFHVSAGREIIRSSWNREKKRFLIAPLGAFVGPGAIGVGIGCLLAEEVRTISLILLGMSGILGAWFLRRFPEVPEVECVVPCQGKESDKIFADLCTSLVFLCVLCRASSGSYIKMPCTNNIFLSIIFFCVIAMGKTAGGFLADRISWFWTGCLASAASWFLIYFGGSMVPGVIVGQFAANMMMPVTLFLLTQSYPRWPGMMFGAAAAVLYPGSLFGKIFNTAAVHLIAAVCFLVAAGLWLRVKKAIRDA